MRRLNNAALHQARRGAASILLKMQMTRLKKNSLFFLLSLVITGGILFSVGDLFAQSYAGADTVSYRALVKYISPKNRTDLPSQLRFFEATNSAGNEYVGWRAPFNLASSYTLIWPVAAPTAGQILQAANGDSIIWGTPGSGDITGVIAGVGLADGGLSGDVTLNVIYAATAGDADTLTLHDFITGTPNTNDVITWNGANWVPGSVASSIIGREVDGSPSIAALSTLEFLQSTGLKFTDQGSNVGRVEIDTSTVWINTKTEIAAQIASAITQKQDDSDTTGFDASKTWVLSKSYLVAADISQKQDDSDTTGFDASKTWVLSKSYLVAADIASKQDDADTNTFDASKTWVLAKSYLVAADIASKQDDADTNTFDASKTWVLAKSYLVAADIVSKQDDSDTTGFDASKTWVLSKSYLVAADISAKQDDSDTTGFDATKTWVLSKNYLTTETGDISAVTAGIGLAGGGTSGAVTIDADTASVYIQTKTENNALYVPLSRMLTAGNGLVGGGDLAANRTIDVIGSDGIFADTDTLRAVLTSTAGIQIKAGVGAIDSLELKLADNTLSKSTAGVKVNAISTSEITDGTILNEDINASAAIALSKIASSNAGRLVITSGGTLTERAALTASALTVGDASNGVASLALGAANFVVGMNSGGTANEYKDILGTSNRVTVTHGANLITLNTPQDLHTAALNQFGRTILDSLRFTNNGGIWANDDTLYFFRKSDGAFQFKLFLGDVPAVDEVLKIGSGRIASWQADAVSGGAGGYSTVQEEGSGLTQRETLNFIGTSFTAADNSGSSRTDVTADADLDALASNSTNGFWARTGAGTGAALTLTGTAGAVQIANGDGSGTPTFTLPSTVSVPTVYAIGSDPADAGVIRLENAAVIGWEASPAGTDVTLTVDASEVMQASGTFNAVTLTESGNGITNNADALGGDLSGNLPNPSVTDDSHAHTGATISGLDISDDTNLTAGDHITLTDDDLDVDDDFVLNTGDAIAGNLDFNDGLTDSPQAIFTPATGTAWKIYTVDSDDDLTIESASSGSTENIDITNPGAGVATLTVEGAISASNFSGTSSGTNTGDQTITLTGNVTGSGTGSFSTTIASSVITASMIANGDHGAFTYASNVATLDASSVSGGAGGIVTDNSLTADDISADAVGASELLESDNFSITGSMTFDGDALHILDTDASHDLIITPGSNLTADHVLTLTTGDADRTLTISGNTTLGGGSHSGTNTGDVTVTGENYLSLSSQQITANAIDLSGTNATGTLAAGRFPALTGDVSNTAGSLTTAIGADKITEAMLKAVNAAVDEDILTYESTTGDFEWHTPAELSLVQTSVTITVAGTSNEITSSAGAQDLSANRTWTLSLPATIDLGGKTSFEIPNGASVTTDAFGEIAADNDAWTASRGAVQFFDGTANTLLVGVLSSDTPTDGQVPKWNTGGTITWEDDAGAGGGASTSEPYITVSNTAGLSAERALAVAANNLSKVDGGANGSITLGLASTLDLAAKVLINDTLFVAEGATADGFETHFTIDDPTADREINFPDADGEVTVLGNASTGSGSVVLNGTPTLVTPDIADFTNAGHTHTGVTSGGVLTSYLYFAPTGAQTFTSDGTTETLTFDFQAAFTTGNQYTIKQTTGNPTGGSLVAVQAADADVSPIMKIENTAAVTIPIGLQIAATNASGVLTTALDLSDAEIATAIALGSNDVTVGGATISSAEFAVLDGGIDLSGSEVTGTLAAARVPAFTGDISNSAGSLTTTIGADKILESMLKAVNAAVDEDILTYESTTGDFEWHTPAELSIVETSRTITIAGTSNEITSSAGAQDLSANRTWTISLPSTIDLGGKTSFEIPNGAAPTVDAFGEIAGDNDLWGASRGAPIFFDGTAATALVNVLVSDTPTNGQVPKWNTGGTITWEDDNNSGGATAWDAIADAAGTGSIDFAGFDQDITSAEDGGDILTITNSDADRAADSNILVLADNDGADANAIYLRMIGDADGTPTNDYIFSQTSFSVGAGIAATFASAASLTIPNGTNPTVSAAGQISIDSEGTTESAIRFYADAEYVVPARYTKSFTITSPIATDDYPVWRTPYAITIRAIHVLCVGGTNVVGGLDEADGNGASSAAVDSDITGSAGTNANDDGALSNPTLDAGDYLMWHTTSISGTPTSVTITFEYTVDAVN